jgi:hypothetical protein
MLDGKGYPYCETPQECEVIMSDTKATEEKLDIVIDLLKHLLAVELARSGVKQTVIAKHVHVATAKMGKMLQGVQKPV